MLALARSQRNVIDARITPVVFLPGIMGSRLRLTKKKDPKSGKTTQTVDWDPDSSVTMLTKWLPASPDDKAQWLGADNPGTVLDSGNGLGPDHCNRGWAGVVAKFYLKLLEALESGLNSSMFKCPVYAFGYDWRQPNVESAKQLVKRVDEILDDTGASTVIFVTHSMGGIVARAAMLDGAFRDRKVSGAVHIGQPVLGAPSAYRRLVAGITEDLDGDLAELLRDKAESVAVMSGIPSVFELLPSDATTTTVKTAHKKWMRYRLAGDPELRTFPESETVHVYMNKASPPGVTEAGPLAKPIRRNTGNAMKFMSPLGARMHPLSAAIYGDDVETDTRAIFNRTTNSWDGSTYDPLEGRSDDGDGTVPTWSAQALFPGQAHEASDPIDPEVQSQWVVRGQAHDMMCASSDVQNATIQFIHALLHPPRLARTRVGSDGATARLKLLAALAGDRSAEMEIRVAKLLVNEGETVTMLAEILNKKSPDLQTSNGIVEVKFSEDATIESGLEAHIMKGLAQIGDHGRLIFVRGTKLVFSAKRCEEILEERFSSWFGPDYKAKVSARPRLVEERDLPQLWSPPPPP